MMAGIEKICEYSGEYPGHLMYGYKHNHIQILPKYRKLFRGKTAHLLFFSVKNEKAFHFRDRRFGRTTVYCYQPEDDSPRYERIHGKLYYWSLDPRNSEKEIAKPLKEVPYYEYALLVPNLPGQVSGIYMNWSYDKGAVIRKLNRLIGSKTLTIKNLNMTYSEWRDSIEEKEK